MMNDTLARVVESLYRRELDMREAAISTAYQRLGASGCLYDGHLITEKDARRPRGRKAWRKNQRTNG